MSITPGGGPVDPVGDCLAGRPCAGRSQRRYGDQGDRRVMATAITPAEARRTAGCAGANPLLAHQEQSRADQRTRRGDPARSARGPRATARHRAVAVMACWSCWPPAPRDARAPRRRPDHLRRTTLADDEQALGARDACPRRSRIPSPAGTTDRARDRAIHDRARPRRASPAPRRAQHHRLRPRRLHRATPTLIAAIKDYFEPGRTVDDLFNDSLELILTNQPDHDQTPQGPLTTRPRPASDSGVLVPRSHQPTPSTTAATPRFARET
jgi:hypothetical protein